MFRTADERLAAGLTILVLMACAYTACVNTGCATSRCPESEVVVQERIAPHWTPPKRESIAPEPEPLDLQSTKMTKAEAEADPKTAHTILGQDISRCLSNDAFLRFLYLTLITRVIAGEFTSPEDP